MNRSRSHAVAALLNLALSLVTIGVTLVLLPQGAQEFERRQGIPYSTLVLELVIGVIGTLCSWGVWRGQRWGVVLTLLVQVISVVLALPGVVAGPTGFDVWASAATVVLGVAIVVLLLRRDRRVERRTGSYA